MEVPEKRISGPLPGSGSQTRIHRGQGELTTEHTSGPHSSCPCSNPTQKPGGERVADLPKDSKAGGSSELMLLRATRGVLILPRARLPTSQRGPGGATQPTFQKKPKIQTEFHVKMPIFKALVLVTHFCLQARPAPAPRPPRPGSGLGLQAVVHCEMETSSFTVRKGLRDHLGLPSTVEMFSTCAIHYSSHL